MTIRDRWIGALYRIATGTKRTRTLLTPIGVAIFCLFTALFVFLALLVDRVIPLRWPISSTLSWALSVPMMIIGLTVTGWSAFHFVRAKGSPVPFNPPPGLVSSGPYKYARNPMLTGAFLLLFGIGFAVRSLSLVLIFAPLFVLANVLEVMHIEEPELTKRLGEDYLAYRERTPMFIPRFTPRK